MLQRSKVYWDMPLKRERIRYSNRTGELLIITKYDSITPIIKNIEQLPPEQQISIPGIAVNIENYKDTILQFAKHNDSLLKLARFEFTKSALKTRLHYFQGLQTLLFAPIDKIKTQLPQPILYRQDSTITESYDLQSAFFYLLEEKESKLKSFTNRIRWSYKPSMLTTYIFYFPSYQILQMKWFTEYSF